MPASGSPTRRNSPAKSLPGSLVLETAVYPPIPASTRFTTGRTRRASAGLA